MFGNGDGIESLGYCSDPIFNGLHCVYDPPGSSTLQDLGQLRQIALSRMTQHLSGAALTTSSLFSLYPDLVYTDPATGEKTINLTALRDRAFATFQAPEPFSLTNNNLAPRVSVSWAPDAGGRTKFFVNWSRFYDKLFLNSVVGEEGPDKIFRYYQADADGVNGLDNPDYGIGRVVSAAPPST